MNRRALVVSAILALLAVASFLLYRRRFDEEASGGYPVKILVIAKPLQAGDVLDDDALSTRTVPRGYVEDRAVVEPDRPKVIGMRIVRSLHPPEALLWSDLPVVSMGRQNLSELVQPGMRAVTIRLEQRAPNVRPGDRIDLIASMPRSELGDLRSSIVLLQNVVVLSLGRNMKVDIDFAAQAGARDPNAAGGLQREIGLLSLNLSVQDAQMLSLAAEKGRLLVALRNPVDQRVTEGMHDVPDSALGDGKQRVMVQEVRRTGVLAQLDPLPEHGLAVGAPDRHAPAPPTSSPPTGRRPPPGRPRR